MSQVKKILIIGSSAYEKFDSEVRIDCYSWQKIGEIKNPRDYHTLIIDLLSISDEKPRSQVPWDEVHLKLSIYTSTQIAKRGGQVVFIGDPRFRIPGPKEIPARHSNINIPFLKWTGLKFDWDNSSGDTIYAVSDNSKYEQYLKRLSQWNYSLKGVVIDESMMGQRIDFQKLNQKGIAVSLLTTKLCTNLSMYALAFKVLLEYYKDEKTRYEIRKKLFYAAGPVIFLPRIDASEDETLEIVLRDICGVIISLPEPQWIHQYIAPGQETVDKEISDYNGKIEKAKVGLEKCEKERTEVRRPLRLLYGTGIDLQDIVWEVLETLGAKVERPEKSNEEDGWLSVEIDGQVHEGVLEVKSTRSNPFNKSGIRQLGEWVARAAVDRDKEHKGIFIGNNSFDRAIKNRKPPFSLNVEQAVRTLHICALTTEYLYKIYWLKLSKKLDISGFWSDVFQTNGIFPIEKYFSGAIPKGDYSS